MTSIELDQDEAAALLKVYCPVRFDRFLPDTIGLEVAQEAMDAMRVVVDELLSLLPPGNIDPSYWSEDFDFYSINIRLPTGQLKALLTLSNRVIDSDVRNWGQSAKTAKELINALWCIKAGLTRSLVNVDPPVS